MSQIQPANSEDSQRYHNYSNQAESKTDNLVQAKTDQKVKGEGEVEI